MKTITPITAASVAGSAHIPWWRHPWLWLVMIGPAVVVVAGLVTWAIAWQGADKLVSADYYQKGLALPKERSTTSSVPMLPAGQARNHAATGGAPGSTETSPKKTVP
ncbi:FixH family protein [Variovorax sp. PCZ-1]|uniref:FixH family protein n=1 Tax=Variovorax sp. PCZ-1 TaxID=2835533 RepID=UPI001BD18F3C|nr:FixH family protein [Variovorax sp. PCZ-1]MBS7807713.1 FixH family protein [Variovorax sp. PCZ-1]